MQFLKKKNYLSFVFLSICCLLFLVACNCNNNPAYGHKVEKGTGGNNITPITNNMVQHAIQNDYRHLSDILTRLQKGEKIDLNVKHSMGNGAGSIALHDAICLDNIKIVDVLLERGADINIKNYHNETALHLATNLHNIEMVKKLILKGASLDVKNHDGYTSLHLAAEQGYVAIAEELMSHLNSEQLSLTNKEGQTPLHLAVLWNHSKIASSLIRHLNISQINQTDKNGKTALDIASAYGHVEIVKKLINSGAEVDGSSNPFGHNPLHTSIIEGQLAVVHEFINILPTEQLSQKDNADYTPLYLAILHGHTEIAEKLIEKLTLAQINVLNDEGNTPLHKAVEKNYIEIVKQLFARGVDKTIKNIEGKTPLDLAITDDMKRLFYSTT
jgi:ankyrin repeat protein